MGESSLRRRALSLCLVALLSGFTGSQSSAQEPLRVVASFSVLADIAARIGGDHATVTSLVGPGGEPHGWSPTPREIRRLAGADLVIVNGLGLEGWLDRVIGASGYAGPVVVASRGVAPILDESGNPDPHAWHSLGNARLYGREIARTLAAARPEQQNRFTENLAAFEAELSATEIRARAGIEAVPANRRVVVTTHDAFAYLGRDFGIEFRSPAGLDSAAQPSARRMAALVSVIRASGVRAVFLEAGGDPRLARTLADEAGVAVGGVLYAGTLSPPDGPAASYAAMWRHNFTLMLAAMGG